MKAGIPRCLSYYYLAPLYRTFLSNLGFEVIESPKASIKDPDLLSLCPTDEPCVSVKSAFYHAQRLLERGADFVLVPAVVSLTEKGYCCPKMIGLPSMLRAGLGAERERVISPVIDVKDDPSGWPTSWVSEARRLGAKDPGQALRALRAGLEALRDEEERAVKSDLCPAEERRTPVTGVVGHAYVLEDVFGSRILEVTGDYGEVVTAEMVPPEDVRRQLATVRDGELIWSIEGRILGASLHLIRNRLVDRLVFAYAFSCGPASIIETYISTEAEMHGIPLLNLAVDEHSGEVGLITRLEAFLDLSRPKRQGGAHTSLPSGSKVAQRGGAVQRGRPGFAAREERLVGLVSMGNLEIPVRALLSGLGVETVLPPPLTDEIVSLGKDIAPEFICYPMVTLIGQMRYHAERGLRKVLMVQGKGRCRLGWYAQVMEEILRRQGYDLRVVAVDSPFPLRTKGRALAESGRELGARLGILSTTRAAALAVAKLQALDRAAALLREVRAVEDERGAGDRRFRSFLGEVETSSTLRALAKAHRDYKADMRSIPRVECDPLDIAVVGEIYVVNEPFVNKDVERMLGSMERRVRVHRSLDVSSWVSYHLFKTPKAVREHLLTTGFAEPYLPVAVGGHGQESVGEAVLGRRRGYDGILHLFPFTCMPEIIAQNILVRVSKDLDIPVLSIMVSEQTGTAGLVTRLEAFCDLLYSRKVARTR